MFSKKIVAAAALLALAAGAQADVKLYGQVDMSVGSFKTPGSTKSVTAVESGVMSTGSYIGFAGTEDLGGGLTAGFTLETYISADTGATPGVNTKTQAPFWGRASNVYLKGAFGKVALGQSDTPVYTATAAYSPFGDSKVFAPAQVALFGGHVAVSGNPPGPTPAMTNFSNGTSELNSITYDTPNVSGLSATVQIGAKESTTAGNKNNMSYSVSYNAGPLSATVAYGKTGSNTLSTFKDVKTTVIGASYDFGVVKGFAQFSNVKNPLPTTFGANAKVTGYTLGAAIPVSAKGSVLLAYGSAKLKTTPVKFSMFSVGYEHSVSKRTSIYAATNTEKFKTPTSVSGHNVAVGIKHNF